MIRRDVRGSLKPPRAGLSVVVAKPLSNRYQTVVRPLSNRCCCQTVVVVVLKRPYKTEEQQQQQREGKGKGNIQEGTETWEKESKISTHMVAKQAHVWMQYKHVYGCC